MPPAELIALLVQYGIPDLIAIGRALYDVLEQKANAQSVAALEVQAAEAAADAAEAAKFPGAT